MKLAPMTDLYLAQSPQITGTQRGALLRMRKESIGQREGHKLTPQHIVQWAEERAETVCSATITGDLSHLRGMLDYAPIGLGIEGVSSLPITLAMPILRRRRLVGANPSRTRVPTPEEHAAILAHVRSRAKHPQVPEVIDYQYHSGRRVSESCRHLWGQLDHAERSILVLDMKHPKMKTGHNVRCALTDEAYAIILRQPRMTDSPDERIFKVPDGTVKTAYQRAKAELKIEGLHLHDYRGGVVTRLLSEGVAPQHVMLVTAHLQPKQVLTTYNRLTAKDFPRKSA